MSKFNRVTINLLDFYSFLKISLSLSLFFPEAHTRFAIFQFTACALNTIRSVISIECQLVREDKWSGATLRMFHARSIYRHLFLDEISATPTSIRRVRCRCDRNKIGASVALEINTSRRPTFTWPSLTGLTFRGTLFKNDVSAAVVSGEPRLWSIRSVRRMCPSFLKNMPSDICLENLARQFND